MNNTEIVHFQAQIELTEARIKNYIRENLKVVVKDDHPRDRVLISLELCGEEISNDHIDYSSVVRVVERLNDEEFN